MVECPRCKSHAVDPYLYNENDEVYYGHHCLNCGLKSSELKEKEK